MPYSDAAAAGLRNLPDVELEEPPRLADFALWISACEETLGMAARRQPFLPDRQI